MARIINTSDLPFEMIDALGFFTVYNNEADAVALADALNVQNANDGVDDCEVVASIRKDGKFLVTVIETIDEACWHAPAALLRKVAA